MQDVTSPDWRTGCATTFKKPSTPARQPTCFYCCFRVFLTDIHKTWRTDTTNSTNVVINIFYNRNLVETDFIMRGYCNWKQSKPEERWSSRPIFSIFPIRNPCFCVWLTIRWLSLKMHCLVSDAASFTSACLWSHSVPHLQQHLMGYMS